MKYRNKILLSIYGVVVSLLLITFVAINFWARNRVESTFADVLQSNFSTLSFLTSLEGEHLLKGSQVLAESPRLRAVAEVGDSATMLQLTEELYLSTGNDVFIVGDRTGRPLVQAIGGKVRSKPLIHPEELLAATKWNSPYGVRAIGENAYRLSYLQLAVEAEVLGVLAVGFQIRQDDLNTIRNFTKSDVILLIGLRPALSTLEPAETQSVAKAIQSIGLPADGSDAAKTFTFTTDDEAYIATTFTPPNGSGASRVRYLLLKAVTRETDTALLPVLGTFGIVSAVFLLITAVLGQIISGGVTRPIQQLVRGTAAISAGDYDYPIQVRGKDELAFLASKFVEMSRALKEKITELANLNKDLRLRNDELDEALQRLREAQDELVRQERLAATGKLTAQLAHEINNPIHNIQSCVKTALGRIPDDTKGRDLILVAMDEIERMSKLTRQMLDFYRNSMVAVEMKPIDVVETIGESVDSAREKLLEAHIAVETLFNDAPLPVHGNSDKLKQVFINLITNAVDAMPEGGTLRVTTKRRNGKAEIAFADTGTGIAKEHIGKIFDAFYTTKSKVSGVGLGLSVSHGIISQHNGAISVASETGAGTTFTLLLPLIDEQDIS